MTREETNRWWHQPTDETVDLLREQHAEIERLRAAVLAEREACAKVAEQYGWSGECRHVATAIRGRGET